MPAGPASDPRYFTGPKGYDDRIMLTGIGLARTIGEQSPLAARVAREPMAMPQLPAANPNITVMTMAEKCADLIRKH